MPPGETDLPAEWQIGNVASGGTHIKGGVVPHRSPPKLNLFLQVRLIAAAVTMGIPWAPIPNFPIF